MMYPVQSATSGSCAISRTVIPGRMHLKQGKYLDIYTPQGMCLGFVNCENVGGSLCTHHDFTFHTLKAPRTETLLLTSERII